MSGKYEESEGLWTFKQELPLLCSCNLLRGALSFSASNVQPRNRGLDYFYVIYP